MKRISLDNPLRKAKWLWPEGDLYLQNCHAQFRHDFELSKIPEKAPFFISADQWYRLYVNGRYVCRGPGRGYQAHWPCDEVDLREFLKTGRNFIAVEAFNPGLGTFQYLHRDAAGMICAADWDDVKIRSCKDSWLMRRSPANNPNVARLSRQMGFQEDFDANADDFSWISSPEPPAWKEDALFRWAGQRDFGAPPWFDLEERGIPLLREELVVPEAIVSQAVGAMKPGYEKCFNIAWHFQGEELAGAKEWLPGSTVASRRLSDGLEFSAEPPAPGEFRAIVLRMPEIQVGTFGIAIDGGDGHEIVDCLYYQYLKDGTPADAIPAKNMGFVSLATRLRVAPRHCSRMFFSPQGAKFVVLVFRGLSRALKAKAVWRTMEYPFSMRGRFETSDPHLDKIRHLCARTQQVCSIDSYVDTPWREQGQWWGDARIQARNTFFLDGDVRLLRRGIYSIAGQVPDSGLTLGVAPCCTESCILPDFSLTWILTIYDYYWQTGKLDVFHDQHERIKRVLAYFESPEGRGANGLLKIDKRFWLFEDWAPLFKDGYPAFINLWHLFALRHYELLLRAAKMDVDADRVRKDAESRKALLEASFFDEKQGLFAGGLHWDGSMAEDAPSLHDQVLAILLGLKPEFHRNMLEKRLLPFLKGERCEFPTPTSFWCAYLFDAAKIAGLRREALDFIRVHWGKMIPYGGAWEHLLFDEKGCHSCCHAWSAHPISHMIELLLGLKQLEPAWAAFECSPDAELLPESGRISIPLPQGDLAFAWSGSSMKVRAPSGSRMLWREGSATRSFQGGEFSFALKRAALMECF